MMTNAISLGGMSKRDVWNTRAAVSVYQSSGSRLCKDLPKDPAI